MYILTSQWSLPILVIALVKAAIADAQITPPTLIRPRQSPSPTTVSTITSVYPQAGINFCFGEGSICQYAGQLLNDCESIGNNIYNQTAFYQCICLNGCVSTGQQ
jgi:hypothetical protein